MTAGCCLLLDAIWHTCIDTKSFDRQHQASARDYFPVSTLPGQYVPPAASDVYTAPLITTTAWTSLRN
jgi:hypothetical protein